MRQVEEHYDLYARHFFKKLKGHCWNSTVFSQDAQEHFATLCKIGEVESAESILDVGCGSGQFIGFIDSSYPRKNILGIDQSQGQIDVAQDNFNPKLYKVGDFTKFQTNDKYDRIFFNETLGYARDEQFEVIEKYLGYLTDGGFLLISTFAITPGSLNRERMALSPGPKVLARSNYRQSLASQGWGYQAELAVAGVLEYERMDLNLLQKKFNIDIIREPRELSKQWNSIRPCSTVVPAYQDLVSSSIIFKIYSSI